MNTQLAVHVQPSRPSPGETANNLWAAGHRLIELSGRVVAGAKPATDIDGIARGLQAIAAELRSAQGGCDAA